MELRSRGSHISGSKRSNQNAIKMEPFTIKNLHDSQHHHQNHNYIDSIIIKNPRRRRKCKESSFSGRVYTNVNNNNNNNITNNNYNNKNNNNNIKINNDNRSRKCYCRISCDCRSFCSNCDKEYSDASDQCGSNCHKLCDGKIYSNTMDTNRNSNRTLFTQNKSSSSIFLLVFLYFIGFLLDTIKCDQGE